MVITPYIGPKDVTGAFTDKDTHPAVLILLLTKEFGDEYVGWEPETLWTEIARKWGGLSMMNRTKIQAARTCLTNTYPYESWTVFEPVACGLMGNPPQFDMVERASPWRCGFALTTMQYLRDDFKIESEIYKYIAASLHDAGFAYATGALLPVNKHLRRLTDATLHDKVAATFKEKRVVQDNSAVALHQSKARHLDDFIEMWRRLMVLQMQRLVEA